MKLVIKDLIVLSVLTKFLMFAAKVIMKHILNPCFVPNFIVLLVNFNVKMVNVLIFKIIVMVIFNMELGIKNQIAPMVLMKFYIIVVQVFMKCILHKHVKN